jgi:hypothetical protein
MYVSIHTHKIQEPTVNVEFTHTTEWNPHLTIEVKPTVSLPLALPDEVTIHIGELSITKAQAFVESWDAATQNLWAWLNERKADENEDVAS